jgi:hypothetical protein
VKAYRQKEWMIHHFCNSNFKNKVKFSFQNHWEEMWVMFISCPIDREIQKPLVVEVGSMMLGSYHRLLGRTLMDLKEQLKFVFR